MWASFKYSLLQLVRVPGVLIWTLVFPIVLGSLFVMMFGALDERAEAVSVNVVVVDEEQAKGEERSALSFENIARAAQAGAQVGSVFDEETFGGQAFASFMEALGEGDDALFNITYVSSPEEAAALVRESLGTDDEYAGYVQYVDGEVRTVLAKATSAAETYEVEPSILMMIMDRYVAEEALIKETLQKNPAALADPGFIETLMAPVEATVRASVTDNAPRESLRYYFALFGMAAFFGASIGLIGFQQIRANASALAARRSLGALSLPEGEELHGVGGMEQIAHGVLVVSLIPASIGFMLGMLGANTAVANSVGNIVGLAISFFGGAWFSISLMEPVVRDIAHWLPGLWYTQACQAVADLCTGAAGAQPSVLFIALGVMVLFALAFFCVGLVAAKKRTQTAEAGGNRGAEAVL